MILPISTRITNIKRARDAASNVAGVGSRNYMVQVLPEEYSFLLRHRTTRQILPLSRCTVVPAGVTPPTTQRSIGNTSN